MNCISFPICTNKLIKTQPRVAQISILERKRELTGEQGKNEAMNTSDCDRENVKKLQLHMGQITGAIRRKW